MGRGFQGITLSSMCTSPVQMSVGVAPDGVVDSDHSSARDQSLVKIQNFITESCFSDAGPEQQLGQVGSDCSV